MLEHCPGTVVDPGRIACTAVVAPGHDGVLLCLQSRPLCPSLPLVTDVATLLL